jgi:pSer/pThr/pTyr-binding forkhead associated (FHA) protein
LEYSRLLSPQVQYGRLVGLILFGLVLGVAYALVERSLSYGVLRVLNGLEKGREFIINQRRMTIGTSERNDIVLKRYRNVAERHVRLRVKRKDVFLEPAEEGARIEVNEDPVANHALKYEDVIKVGTAKLFFKHE